MIRKWFGALPAAALLVYGGAYDRLSLQRLPAMNSM